MMRSIPPRLRAPVIMLVGGAVIDAVAVAAWGWGSLVSLGPITVAAVVGYYVLNGRDSDFAAMLRDQADERQAYRRLKIQALVGRVMTGAAAVAYLVAALAKATLWPFTIFLAMAGVAFLAGWVIYRERPGSREQQVGH
jgi:L-alanine-DL-glutamate epimerase-like enolase superfamily enzyme